MSDFRNIREKVAESNILRNRLRKSFEKLPVWEEADLGLQETGFSESVAKSNRTVKNVDFKSCPDKQGNCQPWRHGHKMMGLIF